MKHFSYKLFLPFFLLFLCKKITIFENLYVIKNENILVTFEVSEPKKMILAFVPPFLYLFILWMFTFLEWGMGWNFWYLGIAPRKAEGLFGIVTHIFVHSDFYHLLANTIPLLVLGWLLFYFYSDIALKVFIWILFLSGIFIWVAGRPGWHVGASSLIYGFIFFLFLSGIIRRHAPVIAVSLVVIFLYGSIIWNMFPIAELVNAETSWEGHLGGALSGAILAVVYRKHGPQRKEYIDDDEKYDDGQENIDLNLCSNINKPSSPKWENNDDGVSGKVEI